MKRALLIVAITAVLAVVGVLAQIYISPMLYACNTSQGACQCPGPP